MATFHPAYLLRNYSDDNRAKVWEDMKKVLAELGLPVPQAVVNRVKTLFGSSKTVLFIRKTYNIAC